MGLFITRIELHEANGEDYELLHDAMKKEGFKQTVLRNDGIEYILPSAEYFIDSPLNRDRIYESAKRVAQTTTKKFWVITSELIGASFYLEKVKK